MKVLVTGATGYLGAAAAEALAMRGHQVLGLARSQGSANALRERGIEPTMGDFGEPASLANAVHEARPDVVVSTASVGGASGDQAAFARDGEAVRAMREALADHGGDGRSRRDRTGRPGRRERARRRDTTRAGVRTRRQFGSQVFDRPGTEGG